MVQGDAADDGTISKLVSSALQEQGQLDVFFANVSRLLSVISRVHILTTFCNHILTIDIFYAFMKAGIASGTASLTAITDADWDRMMHVNTTSCFLAVKYAAPAMMKVRNEVYEARLC